MRARDLSRIIAFAGPQLQLFSRSVLRTLYPTPISRKVEPTGPQWQLFLRSSSGLPRSTDLENSCTYGPAMATILEIGSSAPSPRSTDPENSSAYKPAMATVLKIGSGPPAPISRIVPFTGPQWLLYSRDRWSGLPGAPISKVIVLFFVWKDTRPHRCEEGTEPRIRDGSKGRAHSQLLECTCNATIPQAATVGQQVKLNTEVACLSTAF